MNHGLVVSMRTFGDIPIKDKLMVITMATTTTAFLLAGVGILGFDAVLFRQSLKRDLSALARIIAANSTAALAFDDPRTATETLAALRARPHLVGACIYRSNGTVLATYWRQQTPATQCPPQDLQDELRFSNKSLTVSHAVALSGHRVGTLVLLYDLDEAANRMKLYGGTVLGVFLISSLIAFLLSSRMRSVIEAQISLLVRTANTVTETSDYGVRAQKLSGDEIGMLVDKFNEMLGGIQLRDHSLRTALSEREAALRGAEEARERFRFMAESMPQKIFTASASGGNVEYVNRQWMEYTGQSFELLKNWAWTLLVHTADLAANVASWQHSLETGEEFRCEHRLRRADGVYRWHLSRAHAMRDASGKITMWIGSNTDIHEQKQKEEELRRANEDLQQFVYSASHDLQEPIRNVAVYSEIVARRYRSLLDADGQQFLGFLTEGGRRLTNLITDLLAYTNVGEVDNSGTAVDSSIVLQQVILSLTKAILHSEGTVTNDPLPHVFIGQVHLQQVFQNLIDNALKYRSEGAPQVHISATNEGSAWRFSVRDNGMGIDPRYKELIFGVFKRLVRDQKYSGTGIGLAICQRVIERYGGKIWVQSSLGAGATFFFTIPEPTSAARLTTSKSLTN